jgi:hypothetical protein
VFTIDFNRHNGFFTKHDRCDIPKASENQYDNKKQGGETQLFCTVYIL